MEQAGEEATANLKDVRHGIASGRVVTRGCARAEVEVMTLEGNTLRIEVEVRGWRVLRSGEEKEEEDGWFETLHSLLVAMSEMYKKSFAENISAKLLALNEK
jgi:hypothetical protein